MNKLSSILGGLAVIAIAIVFIVQFRPQSGAQVAAGPACALEVRGSCIGPLHFWTSYRLLAPRGAEADQLRGLRRFTAEGLVDRWLLNEDAKRLGITVSDEDLNAELVSGRWHVSMPLTPMNMGPDGRKVDPRMLPFTYTFGPYARDMIRPMAVKNRTTGKFDVKTYEKEVRQISKMSPQDFRDYQKQELIAARMRDLVRSRVHVGEEEARASYEAEKTTATVGYIRLDKRFYADVVVDPSQKAIDAWAAKNKEESDRVWAQRKAQYTPECRVTRHILARVNEEAADPEAEKAKARKKIDEAKARLDKGEDFASVAREVSDDGSAPEGGMLGCVGKGKMVKPFEDAVFKAEVGKIPDVVETQFGLHLIKVEKINKDVEAEVAGRAEVDKELYTKFESERLAAEAAKEILAAVRGGKTLEQALDTHLAAIKAQVEARAGDGKKAEKKDDKKSDKAKDDKKADKAKDDKATDEKKDEPKTSAALTVDNHPQRPIVETSMPFNESGQVIPGASPGTDVAKMAFKLQKPGDVPDDVVQLMNGYAVMQLKEKKPATKEDWEKDRVAYMDRMRTAKQEDALVAYIARLRNQLGSNDVKYGAEFINEPKAEANSSGQNAPLDPGE